jgi:hypothetical protein
MSFLVLAAAAVAAGTPLPAGRATATIRIVNAAKVTAEAWKEAEHRTDRIVVDEQGRKQRVRIIDFE